MNHSYKKFSIPCTNLSIIRWKPKSIIPIHNHKNQTCSMFILRGSLQENIYNNTGLQGHYLIDTKILTRYQCSFINDEIGEHTLENIYEGDSWSLHYCKKHSNVDFELSNSYY